MIKITVLAAILCGPPKFINETTFDWNEHDARIFEHNKTRCGKAGYEDTPCVSYFKKTGERDYHLVCRPER